MGAIVREKPIHLARPRAVHTVVPDSIWIATERGWGRVRSFPRGDESIRPRGDFSVGTLGVRRLGLAIRWRLYTQASPRPVPTTRDIPEPPRVDWRTPHGTQGPY